MAEQETKKEVTIVTPENPPAWLTEVPLEQRVCVNVGAKRGADTKFVQYFIVPVTDEHAKERYNVTLAELVAIGVRQIAYSVDNSPAFNDKGECDHAILQKQADEYKRGRKGTGAGAVKTAKASMWDQICIDAGFTDPNTPEAKAFVEAAIKSAIAKKAKVKK
jgi:hypothetical protein